jgi:hypothetical protein
VALNHRGAKCWKVCVFLVVLAYIDIREVASGFRAAVDGEMLWRRNDAVIVRIISLHSGDKGHSHARAEKRIFAVGLLAASPTRIAKDVDVGGPEI